MRSLALLLLVSTGCVAGPGALVEGNVRVCLGASDLPEDSGGVEGDQSWKIEGTVVSQSDDAGDEAFEVTGCWSDVQRVLVIEDAESVTWTLGWAVSVEDDPLASELPISPGDSVDLEVIRQVVWGYDHGVVLRDGEGRLLLSAQEGMATDITNADGDPLGDVSVRAGETYGPLVKLDCGNVHNKTIVFESPSQSVELQAGELESFDTGDAVLTAVNAGAFSYEGEMNCTDTWGPTPWAMWQEAD